MPPPQDTTTVHAAAPTDAVVPSAQIGVPSAAALAEEAALLTELLRRRKALEDPAEFSRFMDIAEPAAHHRLLLQGVRDLYDDKADMLIALLPPGSAKSTYLSVVAPTWWLANRPDTRVLAVSNTSMLSSIWGRRVRNLLHVPELQHISAIRLSEDSQAVDNFNTEQGGGYRATGAGAAILGVRADLLVLDDLIASGDDTSEAALAKLTNWMDSDLFSRARPGAKLILVQQRLAYNDPAGVLMRRHANNPRCRVIRLPMLCEEVDVDPATGVDILGRKPGDILWPEWLGSDPKILANAQRSPTLWATMYQQRPIVGTGEWCSREQIGFYDTRPPDLRYLMALDLASGSSVGDYTAIAVVGIDRQRQVYVLEMVKRRIPPNETLDILYDLAGRYGLHSCLGDNDYATKVLASTMRSRSMARNWALKLELLPIGGANKEVRAQALRTLIHDGCFYLPRNAAFTPDLIESLVGFPVLTGPGVDDDIDALSLIARRVASAPLPKRWAPPRPTNAHTFVEDGGTYIPTGLDDLYAAGCGPAPRDMNRIP